MNNYEDWAHLVAKNLEHESSFLAAIDKDELDDKAATEAFIRAVLEPFLPENYGIGAGRVIDAYGKASEFLDIVVYNRDFPRIGLRGTHNAYLYESVLAAFAIRAKFVRKTFFDSLNACASMSHLETKSDQTVLIKLAKKNGLKPGPNRTFVHDDPLRTARFELIGRPPAFVFGFSGFKFSFRQLQENVELWIENRQNVGIATPMKALPAVIATQGCFAWRNAAPLALSNREMLGIGNDDAPVRLIALQLLYLLNRRLGTTSDGYGLKPNLNAYLSQFSAPKFEIGVGNVAEVLDLKPAEKPGEARPGERAARDTQRFEPARDHAAISEAASRAAASSQPEPPAKTEAPVASPATAAAPKPAQPAPAPAAAAAARAPEPVPAAPAPAARAPAPAAAAKAPEPAAAPAAAFGKSSPFGAAPKPPIETPAAASAPDLSSDNAAFDKPSPFDAAPIPPAEKPAAPAATSAPDLSSDNAAFDKPSPFGAAPIPPAEKPAAPGGSPDSAVFDKPSPFASAPKPAAREPDAADAPRSPVPTAPLGSAPIPDLDSSADAMPLPEPELVNIETDEPEAPSPPSAPLGSAPIPPMETTRPAASQPAAAKVIPPKPPVDIDLGIGDSGGSEDKADSSSDDDDDFIETVVIPPNAGLSSKEKSRNSTDAFIARVKEQLSTNEPMAENEKDFTSTIPQ